MGFVGAVLARQRDALGKPLAHPADEPRGVDVAGVTDPLHPRLDHLPGGLGVGRHRQGVHVGSRVVDPRRFDGGEADGDPVVTVEGLGERLAFRGREPFRVVDPLGEDRAVGDAHAGGDHRSQGGALSRFVDPEHGRSLARWA